MSFITFVYFISIIIHIIHKVRWSHPGPAAANGSFHRIVCPTHMSHATPVLVRWARCWMTSRWEVAQQGDRGTAVTYFSGGITMDE